MCVCVIIISVFSPTTMSTLRVETVLVCIVLPKAWHSAHTPEVFDLLNENVSVMYPVVA